MNLPFFVTIPHSGEKVPDLCPWLQGLPETTLMSDVDRFVDRLYAPALQSLKIPSIQTEWHRYAADLNRVPEDIDSDSVDGCENPAGMHTRGFHWVRTYTGISLMKSPMSQATHEKLVELIYQPFHQKVKEQYQLFESQGHSQVYHLDAHSMPSLGTAAHRDPGELRAEIVVSDCHGKSAKESFVDLVIVAYVKAGFKVAYNWPYFGGRVSEQYGDPSQGHQTVQVEMRRGLYMDEETKALKIEDSQKVQNKLQKALMIIQAGIPRL